jgi:hypothetical protein
MMNTSKPTPKQTPEPASSIENPARKVGSIADKIAALKAAGEKQESDKLAPKDLETVPAVTPIACEASADQANSDVQAPEGLAQPAERRLSIKNRIAAMKGGTLPVVAPAPSSRPATRPVSMPVSKSSLESLSPSKDNNPKLEKRESIGDSSINAADSSDMAKTSEPAGPASEPSAITAPEPIPQVSSTVSASSPVPTVAVIESAPPAEEAAVALPQSTVTHEKEAASSDASISSPPEASTAESGSKANSVAAKIAALKQMQQKPVESEVPPPSENKERRRLSTDLKGLGAKINLGGLMPGAPRPILPPRPPSVAQEESAAADASSNRSFSSAVNENGELKHLSLSRPSVNSVSRKRAVKSVKLTFNWQDELTSDDCASAIKSSSSAATTCEDATTTSSAAYALI